ncbi:hypothetical protein ACFOE1_16015 [Agromyces mediolanus]|uniref:DUF2004 domain-containing protein n=1 Tax=Agromyces mediolanus TaxID=41986 RepID=A0A918CH97_AGRME|nr:hypothetical protein [Agromyces mediolanus]GGR23702.1 hypothetical protein GCM10010196_16880 [Agromyces mediolanus]GLJ71054.1 hypothetical protein GCM10017583_03090 [Agromyces mediolanus]
MATEHDYFGVVGDYWSEDVEYADQRVEVVLDAEGESASTAALDAAATLVGELELVDDELRGAFVGQLDSGSSPVVRFLDTLLDADLEQAEDIEAAIGRESGDRQVDALRSLSLVRVDLRPEADGDGEPFAEFEYGLAPDDTDERLVAVIDVAREIVDVRFEG